MATVNVRYKTNYVEPATSATNLSYIESGPSERVEVYSVESYSMANGVLTLVLDGAANHLKYIPLDLLFFIDATDP